jgi:hypothetical protein
VLFGIYDATGLTRHNGMTTLKFKLMYAERGIASQLNLICGEGKFGKIWSAGGQYEIQQTYWRMNKYRYNQGCGSRYTRTPTPTSS